MNREFPMYKVDRIVINDEKNYFCEVVKQTIGEIDNNLKKAGVNFVTLNLISVIVAIVFCFSVRCNVDSPIKVFLIIYGIVVISSFLWFKYFVWVGIQDI